MTRSVLNRACQAVAGLRSSRAIRQSAVAVLIQFATQAIRFGSNIILAGLLSPAIFGILSLVTTLRTGLELLSDIGINQSIIVSEDGDRQAFVETAWALQIIRGALLTLAGIAMSFPMAWLYGNDELGLLLFLASFISVIIGLSRPAPALLQRERRVGRILVQRLAISILGAAVTVAFALVYPTAMGMTIAGVVSAVITMLISYYILPLPGYRPRMKKEYKNRIMSFGRWIFLSSCIYFFATNFDRLYLPSQIPLAIFGVYGLARSFSDIIVHTAAQVNQLVILPAVAQSKDLLFAQRARFGRMRLLGLGGFSLGMGFCIAVSDLLIVTIFDQRYWLAATILPILFAGAWFGLMASLNESVLLGRGIPQPMVGGNAFRFVSTVIILPLALMLPGLLLPIIVIALADLPRYLWLTWHAHKEKLSFGWQDPLLLLVMIGAAGMFRVLMLETGLVDGLVSGVQMMGIDQLVNSN